MVFHDCHQECLEVACGSELNEECYPKMENALYLFDKKDLLTTYSDGSDETPI